MSELTDQNNKSDNPFAKAENTAQQQITENIDEEEENCITPHDEYKIKT